MTWQGNTSENLGFPQLTSFRSPERRTALTGAWQGGLRRGQAVMRLPRRQEETASPEGNLGPEATKARIFLSADKPQLGAQKQVYGNV